MVATPRNELLAWYDANRRDLPWRRTRDPYAIWVSEVMLQQTRVEVAIDYYRRFLERFPDVGSLAAAPIGDVLAVWSGLGYYRRARMLREAAAQVVDRFGGKIPRDFEALRSLKGVGRYTAGAISSIAFRIAVPAVDGNVVRVISRWLALRGDPRRGAALKRIEAEAAAFAAAGRPGDRNQALMELGALVCTPVSPKCDACPVARRCEARRLGVAGEIPPPKRDRPSVAVEQAAAVIERRGRYLFLRRAEGGLNAGLYEFPTTEEPVARLAGFVRESTGLEVRIGAPLARIRHSITFRRIGVCAYGARARSGRPSSRAAWLAESEARSAGLTAAARKILDRVTRKTSP